MPFKLSPKVRKMIIEKLLFSPKRKALYKKVSSALERVVEKPGVSRAYLHGSFVTKKPDPSDIDVVLRTNYPGLLKEKEKIRIGVWPLTEEEWNAGIPLHPVTTSRFGKGNVLPKMFRDTGKKKYGKDYKWIRIAGLAGALGGAGAVVEEILHPNKAEAMPKIPASVRKEIIDKLLTSIRRKHLWKKVGPTVERIVEDPEVRRAYLGGSFVTSKKLPGDVDLLIRTKRSLKENIAEKGLHWPRTSPEEYKLPLDIYTTEKLNALRTSRHEPTTKDLLRVGRNRYGKDYKWIRIAGLTGALGGAGMVGEELLGPEEAEAGPYGKIGKEFIKRITKGVVSSTAKGLKGKPLWGKTVKDVVKGTGDWRYIQFTDGTERAVTKDVMNELMQEYGTASKSVELAGKDAPSKLLQAAKSLEFHKARQKPFTTKRLQEEWLKTRQAHVKSMGMEPSEYVWVDSEKIFMPKEYAEILETSGAVKIKKGTTPVQKYDYSEPYHRQKVNAIKKQIRAGKRPKVIIRPGRLVTEGLHTEQAYKELGLEPNYEYVK